MQPPDVFIELFDFGRIGIDPLLHGVQNLLPHVASRKVEYEVAVGQLISDSIRTAVQTNDRSNLHLPVQ